MILILSILERSRGAWILAGDNRLSQEEFAILPGEDKLLFFLDKFLKQKKTNLKKIKGIILLVREGSLTQIKVFTTAVNALGWQLNIPVIAKFYFKEDFSRILSKTIVNFPKNKKFTPVKAQYNKETVITLSKKQAKYKISK